LVVNAGVMTLKPIDKATPKAMQDMIDVNCYHVAMMIKMLMPILPKKAALIVNSSVSSFNFMPSGAVYSASKAFVTFLIKGIARE
jgi:NADP-dependent 3-hydroxy acid dehydrogenase YdfG